MFRSFLLCFFFMPMALFAQVGKEVEGYIVDATDNQALAGASINAGGKHTVTDYRGYFKILINPSETLKISLLSYKSLELSYTHVKQNAVHRLEPLTQSIQEVSIIADSKRLRDNIAGVQKLQSKDLALTVGFMGQKDPIKAIAHLPGVGNGGEGNAGLFIRGGSSGQNLTLLNDAVIYNPSHLLGLFSVFNPDVANEVILYKNGSPAQFPTRLSGMVEVKTDDLVADSLTANADVSLFALNGNAQIPITNNWSLGVYARKTFFNQTVWPLLEEVGQSSFFKKIAYDFYDLNIVSNAKIGQSGKLQLSVYHGGDDFNFSLNNFGIKNGMGWSNTAGSAKYSVVLGKNVIAKTIINFSNYKFNYSLNQDEYQAGLTSETEDLGLQQIFQIYKNKNQIQLGLQYTRHRFKPNTPFSSSFGELLVQGSGHVYHVNDWAFFATHRRPLTQKLTLDASLRLNYFQNVGPYNYTKSNGEEAKIPIGKTVSDYVLLSPKLELDYALSEVSALKLALSREAQALHQISVTAVNFPADFWMPAINDSKPAIALQSSLGYYADLEGNGYSFFAELYYKKMKHLVEFSSGIVNLLDDIGIEDHLLKGKGESYGLELFARKNQGKNTGSVSYTLAYANRTFADLNDGKPFPFKYDRRHHLVVNYQRKLNSKWNVSAAFNLSSGNAFTMPAGRYLIGGNIVNEYGPYNGSRMPLFHRLDLATTRQLKQTKRTQSSLAFSIYNLYGRQNPIYTFFLAEGDIDKQRVAVSRKDISLLPFLPSINYRVKFR